MKYSYELQDGMSSLEDSGIKFTKALEELDRYLDQYDPTQGVLDRIEELNKKVDSTTDKALKEYQRTRKVLLKL